MADELPPDRDDDDDEDILREVANIEQEVADIVGGTDQYTFVEDVGALQDVYYLWILWADFHIYIISPYVQPQKPAKIIKPEVDPKTKQAEDVYDIFDFADMLSTSRGPDMVKGLRVTRKYLNTVEKMIRIVISRVHGGEGGVDEPEPRVAFRGHEIGQRKGFETAVNLDPKLEIVNFTPAEWGDRHLNAIEEMVRRGYGPPTFGK